MDYEPRPAPADGVDGAERERSLPYPTMPFSDIRETSKLAYENCKEDMRQMRGRARVLVVACAGGIGTALTLLGSQESEVAPTELLAALGAIACIVFAVWRLVGREIPGFVNTGLTLLRAEENLGFYSEHADGPFCPDGNTTPLRQPSEASIEARFLRGAQWTCVGLGAIGAGVCILIFITASGA